MKNLRWFALLVGSLLAFFTGMVHAESQYGYDSAGGAGAVTATARVGLSVTVPKIVLLRVGASNATVSTVTFNVSATIPAGAVTAVDGSNTAVDWDGNAPTFTPAVSGSADLTASAFTNAAAGGSLSCVVSNLGTSNILATNFSVTAVGSLGHPGVTMCDAPAGFARGAVRTSTWTYGMNNTNAATWEPGTYGITVTYTATTL